MRHGPNVWVVRRGSRFSIRLEGTPPFLLVPTTQRIATFIARFIARVNRSELTVQSRSGRIRAKDSHGFDSPRRKG